MEERQSRLFLAILLTMAVWMGINAYFFPPPAEPQTENSKDKTVQTDKKADTKKVAGLAPVEVNSSQIKSHFIVTDAFLIEFSTLGGRIEKFYARNYLDLEGGEVKLMKKEETPVTFDGKQYKAVEISRGKGFDFNPVLSRDTMNNSYFNNVNFSSSWDEKEMKLVFEAPYADKKFSIRKVFRFFPKEHYFKFDLVINNHTNGVLELATGSKEYFFKSFSSLGPTRENGVILDRDKPHYFRFYHLNGSFNDTLDNTSAEGYLGDDGDGDDRFEVITSDTTDKIDFAGTGSRYFIGVLDPINHQPDGVLLDNRDNNTTGTVLLYKDLKINPGESKALNFAAYTGIREIDGMTFRDKSLDPNRTKGAEFTGLSANLDESFNQGITTPFRNGIVWLLKKLNTFTIPNYGWNIIIFGILFKLVFYPLNQKQAESMKKMQTLAPDIKIINEKYGNDPQLKQQKIMQLYKENNANPMGGCLPMVIQIPIFIALYTAFSDTIELWKTPFLWIPDLSEPDTVFYFPDMLGMSGLTLNILPLVMVVSQILMTKMTSVQTDPNQKAMIYIMPVVMLFFFWSMPSGVTLYWTVQNFMSVGQQVYTNKFGPEIKLKIGKKKKS